MRELCEKCSGKVIWYEVHDNKQVMVRCMCGWSKWILKQCKDGSTIRRGKVELPRSGSKLFTVLELVATNAPVSTQQLAAATGDPTGIVGTQLSVLHAKGLVDRLKNGKGKAGGSQWGLSQIARDLI